MAADFPAIEALPGNGELTIVVDRMQLPGALGVQRIYVFLNRALPVGQRDVRFRYASEIPSAQLVEGSKKAGVQILHPAMQWEAEVQVIGLIGCSGRRWLDTWDEDITTRPRYFVVIWRAGGSGPFTAISGIIDRTALRVQSPGCP